VRRELGQLVIPRGSLTVGRAARVLWSAACAESNEPDVVFHVTPVAVVSDSIDGDGRSIEVRDPGTGSVRFSVPIGPRQASALVSGTVLLVASEEILAFDLVTGERLYALPVRATRLVLAPDGDLLVHTEERLEKLRWGEPRRAPGERTGVPVEGEGHDDHADEHGRWSRPAEKGHGTAVDAEGRKLWEGDFEFVRDADASTFLFGGMGAEATYGRSQVHAVDRRTGKERFVTDVMGAFHQAGRLGRDGAIITGADEISAYTLDGEVLWTVPWPALTVFGLELLPGLVFARGGSGVLVGLALDP